MKLKARERVSRCEWEKYDQWCAYWTHLRAGLPLPGDIHPLLLDRLGRRWWGQVYFEQLSGAPLRTFVREQIGPYPRKPPISERSLRSYQPKSLVLDRPGFTFKQARAILGGVFSIDLGQMFKIHSRAVRDFCVYGQPLSDHHAYSLIAAILNHLPSQMHVPLLADDFLPDLRSEVAVEREDGALVDPLDLDRSAFESPR